METPLSQVSPQAPNTNVNPTNPEPKKRDPWGRVLSVNLLIFLGYSALAYITEGYAGVFTVFSYLIHVGILLVLSFALAIMANVYKRSYNASAYFASAGIIFVLGFGVCAVTIMVNGLF
jgi:hypothetical protein